MNIKDTQDNIVMLELNGNKYCGNCLAEVSDKEKYLLDCLSLLDQTLAMEGKDKNSVARVIIDSALRMGRG